MPELDLDRVWGKPYFPLSHIQDHLPSQINVLGPVTRLQPSDTPSACWVIITSLGCFVCDTCGILASAWLPARPFDFISLGVAGSPVFGSNPSLPCDSAELVPTLCCQTAGWSSGAGQLGGCRSGKGGGHQSGGLYHVSPSVAVWPWLSHFSLQDPSFSTSKLSRLDGKFSSFQTGRNLETSKDAQSGAGSPAFSGVFQPPL